SSSSRRQPTCLTDSSSGVGASGPTAPPLPPFSDPKLLQPQLQHATLVPRSRAIPPGCDEAPRRVHPPKPPIFGNRNPAEGRRGRSEDRRAGTEDAAGGTPATCRRR